MNDVSVRMQPGTPAHSWAKHKMASDSKEETKEEQETQRKQQNRQRENTERNKK
jgi:hypothetical protein